MRGSALVLGGGGVVGVAWETGVLYGLEAAGINVSGVDFVLGTSAGSVVGAQLGSGLPLSELFERQANPLLQNRELVPAAAGGADFLELAAKLAEETSDPTELRRRIGAHALAAATVSEPERLAVVEGRLPVRTWPERPLSIVAVDAHTGEPRVFDRSSGVALVDAVAASCAVPGVWPPVTIGGARYIDGAVRSVANADLVTDYQRVLVLAPIPDDVLERQVAGLALAELITPDEAALAAFGTELLDPAVRTPAAHAGRTQGDRLAPVVAELLGRV